MDVLDKSDLGEYEAASALLDREESGDDMLPPSQLRRSRRKHWKEPVLNITSFVDVLAVLMFFLLTVTTLEKLGAHEVNLPTTSESFAEESKVEVKNLSLSLSREDLRLRALLTPNEGEPEKLAVQIPVDGDGYDLERLQSELLRLKSEYETDKSIILMVADDVHFDWVVKVMDTAREDVEYRNNQRFVTPLFPNISLSDYRLGPGPDGNDTNERD